jgi:uncharacterized protein (TIGR03086 family)
MLTVAPSPVLHRRAVELAGGFVDRVGPADLDLPTPCAGWDLRRLLAHMIGQNHGFADAAERDVGAEAFAERSLDADIRESWAVSADRVTHALEAAVATDRTVVLAEFSATHRFPAAQVLGMHLLDSAVHAWDVATALGRPCRPDDELVAATLGVAELIPDGDFRDRPGAAFAHALPVPPDDDPWSRALRLLGRQPA